MNAMKQDVSSLIKDRMEAAGLPDDRGLFIKAFMFLADNSFFGHGWEYVDGALMVCNDKEDDIAKRLDRFLQHIDEPWEQKLQFLKEDLAERFPVTMERLALLQEKAHGQFAKDCFPFLDYMAANLKTELHLMSSQELRDLAEAMDREAPKEAVDELAFLASWMKQKYEVSYTVEIRPVKRARSTAGEAYSLPLICRLYHTFFNEDSIKEKEMILHACEDAAYADTFLFFSIHLVCSLRNPEIDRLPCLYIADPEKALRSIRDGSFTDAMAVEALHSIMDHLGQIAPVPNKTRKASGVPSVYLYIPQSLEAHFGRLFVICSAHRLIDRRTDDGFLSMRRTSYWQIRKLMGEEVAAPFLERDPSPTAFSKSFMQGLALLAGTEGEKSGPERLMLGYLLAARARSHKGGYGSFSASTATYLKDNALTGLGPSMVARELFERGIMSFIPSMLLSVITQGGFDRLSFPQQTRLIQELGLDALEVEKAMDLFLEAREKAKETAAGILRLSKEERPEGICRILHSLAIGIAPGKDPGALCFIEAMDRPCPFPSCRTCLTCRYRIDTRATLFHIGGEYKRLLRLKGSAVSDGEKLKYRLILEQYLLPAVSDVLSQTAAVIDAETGDLVGTIILEASGLAGEAQT